MCKSCKCPFTMEKAQELIQQHGLKEILTVLALSARAADKDGDHPGYSLVADKLIHLMGLVKK